jgi:hypothetical protein
MARKKMKPKMPLRRTRPLTSEQREAFVREFLESFDAIDAAKRAGYEAPHIIGPQLLEQSDIQERLRGYRSGIDEPAHTASSISKHLLRCALKTRKPDLTPDIVTGQMRPNWELINEQDAENVDYDEVIQNKGGIPYRTMRLHKRPTLDAIKILMQRRDASMQISGGEDSPLRDAFRQLHKTGSRMPIVPCADLPESATTKHRKDGAAGP